MHAYKQASEYTIERLGQAIQNDCSRTWMLYYIRKTAKDIVR